MASYHFSVKSGKKGAAVEHAVYIARDGKHGGDKRGNDLIYKECGNLPEWANNDPFCFWKGADKNERVNGSAYREFEIALPSELSIEQNIELVKDIITNQIGKKTYHAAIHSSDATLGKVKQPHLHLMFSDRIQDGIVRSQEQHFRRFNRIKPELGGCQKDSGGRDSYVLKEELVFCRESIANIQNAHLEKHGHSARVDHRSNKDRGIDKEPERHLGQSGVMKLSEEEKLAYLAKRKTKQRG